MKIAFPILWVILWVLLNACETSTPPTPKVTLSYPENYRDTSQVDSLFSVPFHRYYQWMQAPNTPQLKQWRTAQLALSIQELPPLQVSNLKSPDTELNFLSLPQLHSEDFYVLAQKASKRGLYKGSDLSTISTYEPYLLDEQLPKSNLQILDFEFADKLLVLNCLNTETGENRLSIQNLTTKQFYWPDSMVRFDDFQVIAQELHILQLNEKGRVPSLAVLDLNNQDVQNYPLPGESSSDYELLELPKNSPSILIIEKAITGNLITWSFSNPEKKFIQIDDVSSSAQFLGFQEFTPAFAVSDTSFQTKIYSIGLDSLSENLNVQLDLAREQLVFQNGIFTGQEFHLIFANPKEAFFYVLDKAGKIIEQKRLPALLSVDQVRHYPSLNTTLIQYYALPGGTQWISYNDSYPIPIEPVYQDLSLLSKEQVQVRIDSIIAYDGIKFPVIIVHKKGLVNKKNVPSIILSLNHQFATLYDNPAVSLLLQDFLKHDGIIGIPLVRGSRNLGVEWEAAGQRHALQLSYDDLQAFVSFLNQEKIGAPNSRRLIGMGPGTLNAAALLVQRPELIDKAILFDGFLDLLNHRDYLDVAWNAGDLYGNPLDSIDFYYLKAYTPIQYPLIGNNSSDVLLICKYPFIFANQVSAYKFLARLQDHGSSGKKLLWQENTYTINNAYSLYNYFLGFPN